MDERFAVNGWIGAALQREFATLWFLLSPFLTSVEPQPSEQNVIAREPKATAAIQGP